MNLSFACFALPNDNQQPITIKADQVRYEHKQGIVTYYGHVEIHQGTTALFSDKLITYINSDNKISSAIAFGNPAHYQTLQTKDKPPLLAQASEIRYNLDNKIIVLLGQAKVTQGSNQLTSPKIVYNQNKQQVNSFSNKNEKTIIVFRPQTLNKQKNSS